jgi:hypothetical protein
MPAMFASASSIGEMNSLESSRRKSFEVGGMSLDFEVLLGVLLDILDLEVES